MTTKFYEELEARGLISDVSSPELKEILNTKKISFYIGYDQLQNHCKLEIFLPSSR